MTGSEDVRVPEMLEQILAHFPGRTSARSIHSVRTLPARQADLRPMPSDLDPRLELSLASQEIRQLRSHQLAAWDAVQAGRDVVIVTSTASGKTLCFNLPVVDRCLKFPSARAVYFYPTKALANDQLASLRRLVAPLGDEAPTVAAFHGDLSREERRAVLDRPPSILLATPDILHHQQLPKHPEWAAWWASLHFVIVDEAHVYRGVFGAHMAHVMRRIRRVATHYGASPQFISSTATIGNPVEHVTSLIGREPALIDRDGSPQATRDVVVWDPFIYDSALTPLAFQSSEHEAADLFTAAILAGYSTICFAKARRSVERIRRRVLRATRQARREDLGQRIASYRAGYSRQRREEIEAGLRSGELIGVLTTVALELGVDIGALDVAVLASYPGSAMGFRQQAGRAGRRERAALVVMVASQNPLDRYVADHPELLLDTPAEQAVLDIGNERISIGQVGCALRELPISPGDHALYGQDLGVATRKLLDLGAAEARQGAFHATRSTPRPREVALRAIDGASYDLVAYGRVIGTLEARYVPREGYPGAIYLHDGDAYRVIAVDQARRVIGLESSDDEVLTEPIGERYIDLLSAQDSKDLFGGAAEIALGRLKVRSITNGFREVHESTGRPFGGPRAIAPALIADLWTVGLRITGRAGAPVEGLHAVEHLLRSLAPLTILCDRGDLDGHTEVTVPAQAFVYDKHEGGVGLAERIFANIDPILEAVARHLDACPCANGCPSCIQSSSCMLENDAIDKGSAKSLLRAN